MPPRIRVMISSRCNDPIELEGQPSNLSAVRQRLKDDLEAVGLFGSPLFEVWINELAPAAEGTNDSWEECLQQVRDADVVVVLYNGNAGWAKQGSEIGVCHAELLTALSTAAAKIRLIELPLQPVGAGAAGARNARFRQYVEAQSLFRGAVAGNGSQAIMRVNAALREAVAAMVRLGVREARRGKYHTGDALAWHRFGYAERRQVMLTTLHDSLTGRTDAVDVGEQHVTVRIDGKNILVACHAIPDALTVTASLEGIGQPFLSDHLLLPILEDGRLGPIHLFACNRGVTENQARKILGFPDATIVMAPFGVYVADSVQKIQLVFITQCRDETSTRHGVQRLFEWLEQAGEGKPLAERAAARKRIAKAIQKEANDD